MLRIFSHSRQAALSPRRRSAPQRIVATGLAGGALVLVAACGSSPAGGGSAGNPLTPRQALMAAASQGRQVTSATETLNVKASGLQNETTSGTILIELKPALKLSANLSIGAGGKNTPIKEVLTGSAIYFSSPALTGQTSKPWVKIPLSALKGAAGASFAQLFHSLQSNNFTNQTELLTVAKNAHVVGTQTVDGESTTEYAGSLNAAEGLKALPAGFRKALAGELKALGNSVISFHVWIDGQKHVRKITEVETINGEHVSTTVNIAAINQPVHIAVPPASQTTGFPGR